MNTVRNFGRVVALELNSIGKNQSWLAEQTQVSQGTISRLISGVIRPDVDTLRKLCTCWPDQQTNTRVLIEHLRDEVARAGIEAGRVFIRPSEAPDITEIHALLDTIARYDTELLKHLLILVRDLVSLLAPASERFAVAERATPATLPPPANTAPFKIRRRKSS